ncbi:hypothetical protein J6590_030804 [Homalodisca vitripennis]|nr:hypothetical protein J6590_030804 [Homalodisca vitripennis]
MLATSDWRNFMAAGLFSRHRPLDRRNSRVYEPVTGGARTVNKKRGDKNRLPHSPGRSAADVPACWCGIVPEAAGREMRLDSCVEGHLESPILAADVPACWCGIVPEATGREVRFDSFVEGYLELS